MVGSTMGSPRGSSRVGRMVPASIRYVASAMGSTASMTGATISAVTPLEARRADQSGQGVQAVLVQPAERLVQKDHRRVGQQCPGHHQTLALTGGHSRHLAPGHLREMEILEKAMRIARR